MIHLEFWPTLAFVGMMLSCFVFVIVFLVRSKPPSAPESKRERASIVGIVLQGASYGIVWSIRRAWFSPIVSESNSVEIAFAILTMALGIASVWFIMAAIRTLGQQWGLGAPFVAAHKFVTAHPYPVVRHPLY